MALGYFLRRFRHAMLVILVVPLLSFLVLQAAPGEFGSDLRVDPQVSATTIDSIRAHYGLDQSATVRYGAWLKAVAHGDFGYSFAYNVPAAPIVFERARNTLLLSVSAGAIAWALAIPLGVLSAATKNHWFDTICGATTSFMLGVPELLAALMLLIIADRTHWLPIAGIADEVGGAAGISAFRHMLLPVCAIVFVMLPTLVRHVRASMIDSLQRPYVRAARANGLRRPVLLFRYALRAAANPILSLAGLSVASLLSVSLIVEIVFAWPGFGPMLLDAIHARDTYVIIDAGLLTTLLVVFASYAADIAIFVCDPRIRSERA
ncbi:MAG TPA: ABC transporter permease [Terriglobales bacterium]